MKMSERFRALIVGGIIGFILAIPFVFGHLMWYLYGIGVLLIYGLFVGILHYHTDFHYVHKPFRNKKNKWLRFYCFIFCHHAFVHNNLEDKICTTCGKISKAENPDRGMWSITVSKQTR